jgi:Holliday junction DNA helicase RuvA
MYEYIRGKVIELTPTVAVVEAASVGYGINISLNTYSAIEETAQNKGEVLLYIYEAVREDAFTLYGFSSKEERALFLLLISVSGVGASSARVILSAYSVNELLSIISAENVKMLKSIKGIGTKTAERIIVDLKDKVQKVGEAELETNLLSPAKEEAVAALVVLGYAQSAAAKICEAILKESPSLSIEKLIKEALNRLR